VVTGIGLAWRLAFALAVVSMLGEGAALAQSDQSGKIIDEVKVGVLDHDITLGGRGIDLNGEILFTAPDMLGFLGGPRPHFGVAVNTDGNTDQAYFGLTWGLPLVKHIAGQGDALSIYGSLGGALHDGFIDSAPEGRKKLGSVILFRESVELGYQVTETNSVSLIVDHISNANLGNHNAGITSAGGRIGFKF
jgi:lipid A 3-O-deacylase